MNDTVTKGIDHNDKKENSGNTELPERITLFERFRPETNSYVYMLAGVLSSVLITAGIANDDGVLSMIGGIIFIVLVCMGIYFLFTDPKNRGR